MQNGAEFGTLRFWDRTFESWNFSGLGFRFRGDASIVQCVERSLTEWNGVTAE